jgi:zinc protease
MRSKLSLLCLSMVVYTISFSQAKLVEKVTKKGDEVVIPYEKYVLPNGLTDRSRRSQRSRRAC